MDPGGTPVAEIPVEEDEFHDIEEGNDSEEPAPGNAFWARRVADGRPVGGALLLHPEPSLADPSTYMVVNICVNTNGFQLLSAPSVEGKWTRVVYLKDALKGLAKANLLCTCAVETSGHTRMPPAAMEVLPSLGKYSHLPVGVVGERTTRAAMVSWGSWTGDLFANNKCAYLIGGTIISVIISGAIYLMVSYVAKKAGLLALSPPSLLPEASSPPASPSPKG